MTLDHGWLFRDHRCYTRVERIAPGMVANLGSMVVGDADLVGIEKTELRTDFGRVLLVDKVDSVFPFPLKF